MAERIYIRNGKTLEPMEEQRFALEDELQELLAERPDLIDGEQVSPGNPRRWLLVKREMGVPAVAGGTAWWGLDHLLLDQDAVPTLVEVKRGKSAQIHYEIVGQMMNYAAHGSLGGTGGARIRSKISLDEFMSLLPSDAVRDATQRLLDVAQECGAEVVFGDKGVTIRTQMPEGGPPSRITVAWLYPPGGPFWMGLKNYAFGESVTDWAELPPKRKEALDAWVRQFEGDGDAFGGQWSGAVRACVIDHENVATRVDALEERLAKVIGDLQAP